MHNRAQKAQSQIDREASCPGRVCTPSYQAGGIYRQTGHTPCCVTFAVISTGGLLPLHDHDEQGRSREGADGAARELCRSPLHTRLLSLPLTTLTR